MYKLVIADDEGNTNIVPLLEDEITIGRKETNTVCLPERNISRLHARVRRIDGRHRIEDHSSYTGVIINGKRISKPSWLKPGDEIVIGDFRLALQLEPDMHAAGGGFFQGARDTQPESVPAGMLPAEFQSHAEVEMPVGGGRPSLRARMRGARAPIYVASAIVVLALMAAFFILQDAMARRETVALRASHAQESVAADEEFWSALRDCQMALEAQDYERANSYGSRALTLRPENLQARRCRDAAERAQRELAAFQTGKELLEQGEVEAAYHQFHDNLESSSAFRSRPEVIQASHRYAELQVDAAEQHIASDPERAQEMLEGVVAMEDAPEDARAKAEALLEKQAQKEERLASAGKTAALADAPRRPRPTQPERVPVSSPPEPAAPAPKVEPAVSVTAPVGIEAARECLRQGDNRCALVALRRANTAAELALRIETHRQMGSIDAAVRDMRVYVNRYPSDVRAVEYRQYIQLHE